MRRKGFTLVELLVVIAIIALLMGILMPALARVRQLAFRMTCGTNLSGIGKAMLIYANDYQDELPRAGGRASQWGRVANWLAPDRYTAYGITRATGEGGAASITSCFYLLVKYAEVTPKSFVCKGDAGTSEFKLANLPAGTVPTNIELIDCWDFGPSDATNNPSKYCSYSYHIPFGLYALTTSSEPGFAVAADRNPWISSPGATAQTFPGSPLTFQPDIDPWKASTERARMGNAITHQSDGQNVLFLDSHVEFAKRAYCSMEDDNIYTISTRGATQQGDPLGTWTTVSPTLVPACRKDSLLVHDDPTFTPGTGPTPRPRPSNHSGGR
jgi:prepilin-type N-terminal cleavage/methylation domain-containing protein